MSGGIFGPNDWRGYRREDFPAESWAVEGDVLHALPGAAPVSLISRSRFGDFDLSFEWRLAEGGNSGVLYKVTEKEDEPWMSGLEMQLVDHAARPDAEVPETSCGALYGLQAPQGAAACHRGLYNVGRISVRRSHVEHWLNGVRVLACDLKSGEFQASVAKSKFARFPRFARAAKGHIVLQHHGEEAWFHDVRIET